MSGEQRVPCPSCAELILPAAAVCRYCGRPTAPDGALSEPAKESSGYGCLIAALVVAAIVIFVIFMGISANYG